MRSFVSSRQETAARHYMVLWIFSCTHISHTGILYEAVKLIITYADSKCSARGLVARCSPGGLFKGTHCSAARPRHIDAMRSFVSSRQETAARHYMVLLSFWCTHNSRHLLDVIWYCDTHQPLRSACTNAAPQSDCTSASCGRQKLPGLRVPHCALLLQARSHVARKCQREQTANTTTQPNHNITNYMEDSPPPNWYLIMF